MAYVINPLSKITTPYDYLKYDNYQQAFVHRAFSIALRAAGGVAPEMLCKPRLLGDIQ
jgi:hypothetical protein